MPVYPEVRRAEGVFKQTYDYAVLIESMTATADPEAPEMVYVNFSQKRRWKQTGNCNRCGIADFNMAADDSIDFGDYDIVLEPGKSIGEVNSVLDRSYAMRLDYPCTPEYPVQTRKMAADMGIPYVCGLRFEELEWIY